LTAMMPMPLEVPAAATMIAAVAAVAQASETWSSTRDAPTTAEVFDQTFTALRDDPDVLSEADSVTDLIPEEVLGTMTRRIDECWKKFRAVIEPGGFLPGDVDDAVEQVKACICRELRRMYGPPSRIRRAVMKHESPRKIPVELRRGAGPVDCTGGVIQD